MTEEFQAERVLTTKAVTDTASAIWEELNSLSNNHNVYAAIHAVDGLSHNEYQTVPWWTFYVVANSHTEVNYLLICETCSRSLIHMIPHSNYSNMSVLLITG